VFTTRAERSYLRRTDTGAITIQIETTHIEEHTEHNREEIFLNQQPANLQTEVRKYVLYKNNKYLYKRLIRGCLFTHRQKPHR
jgi:hypothetical protein